MSETIVRRHLIVRGRVQGVAFRFRTKERAQELGLAGWVRNRPDGSVEAVLEGPAGAVALAEAFCAQGAPPARVAAIEARDEAPEGLFGFTIR